jgi:hypothetical protein
MTKPWSDDEAFGARHLADDGSVGYEIYLDFDSIIRTIENILSLDEQFYEEENNE